MDGDLSLPRGARGRGRPMKGGHSHCALQNPWDIYAKTSSEKPATADPRRVLGGDSYELGDSLGRAGRPPTGVAQSPPGLGSGSWRGLPAGLQVCKPSQQ